MGMKSLKCDVSYAKLPMLVEGNVVWEDWPMIPPHNIVAGTVGPRK